VPISAEALPVPLADTHRVGTWLQFRKILLSGTEVAPLVAVASAAAGPAPTTLAAATSSAAALARPFD
jgi:hypothetical protein